AEVEDFIALEVGKDLGVEHIDAGVDRVAKDLAPTGFFEELLNTSIVASDDDAVLQWVGDMSEGQRRHRLALTVKFDDVAEVEVGEGVAADNQERLRQHVLGVLDTASSA